jgi:hypothetical protein
VIKTISPTKDVDGFHPENVGKLCIGQSGFVSCTPAGIIELLKRSNIEIEGKECVIIGVNERLEIWSLEEFNNYMKVNEESLEEITEDIFDSNYEA